MIKALKYIVFSCLIIGSLVVLQVFTGQYQAMGAETFAGQMNLATFVLNAGGIPVGLLLGFEAFLKEAKKKGSWRMDLSRLIFLGVPAAVITFIAPLHYSSMVPGWLAPYVDAVYSATHLTGIHLAGLLLGYVVVSSFYKRELVFHKPRRDLLF